MLSELFKSAFAAERIQNMRDSIFRKIEKVLSIRPKDIQEEVKVKTNKLIIDAEIEAQREWITKTLEERQLKIDKNKPTQEIINEKDEFRRQIYQATKSQEQNKLKESSHTFTK